MTITFITTFSLLWVNLEAVLHLANDFSATPSLGTNAMRNRALPCIHIPGRWSDLGHAAVDEELDASDVATFVRSEEGDHFGNFVQGSRATEGYFAHHAVCVLFDLFFRHAQGIAVARRRNHPWTNSVHADFAVFEICGEGAREGPHGRFGCAVHAQRGRSCYGDDRRIQNDRASILKKRERFLDRKQKTLDIG